LRWDAEEDGLSLLPFRASSPIVWTPAEGGLISFRLARSGRAQQGKAAHAALLDAANRGATLAEAVADAQRAMPEAPGSVLRHLARHFLFALHREGMVDIATPEAPRVFAGRYERVRELGRGAEGIAWLCHDLGHQGHAMVVKHAWNFVQPFADAEAGLRREGACLAGLDHPGVVRWIGAFEEEGRYHVARAFVEGPDLATLREHGPLPAEERRARLRELASAVAHAHARGWLLVDLKPNNALLDRQGRAVISDVGLACLHERGLATAPGVGGALYTAPEVVQRRAASVASDLWGLGRIAFYLATGRHARPDEAPAALAAELRTSGAAAEAALVEATGDADPAKRLGSAEGALALL
jgi:hypothetical protein